jgi:hypothetical protein
MANVVNRNVTKWFDTDYADLYHIHTAHDFILSSDLVQITIDRNHEMTRQKSHSVK